MRCNIILTGIMKRILNIWWKHHCDKNAGHYCVIFQRDTATLLIWTHVDKQYVMPTELNTRLFSCSQIVILLHIHCMNISKTKQWLHKVNKISVLTCPVLSSHFLPGWHRAWQEPLQWGLASLGDSSHLLLGKDGSQTFPLPPYGVSWSLGCCCYSDPFAIVSLWQL